MYRSTARRMRGVATWSITAAISIGSGALVVVAAHSSPAARVLTANPGVGGVAAAPAGVVGAASTAPRAGSTVPIVPTGTGVPTSVVPSSAAPSSAARPTVSQGVIVSRSPSAFTVRGRSGVLTTYSLTGATAILSGHSRVSAASLLVGSTVYVVSSPTSPGVAASIGVVPTAAGGGDGGGDGGDGGNAGVTYTGTTSGGQPAYQSGGDN